MNKIHLALASLCVMAFFSEGACAALAQFSTAPGAVSWTIKEAGQAYDMTFDNLVVGNSEPASPELVGDKVIIPRILLAIIADDGAGTITATLTPSDDKLRIQDDSGLGDVLVADITEGVMISLWNDLMGYSSEQSDLDNVTVMISGYSSVTDGFAQAGAAGLIFDFAFAGSSLTSLYALLSGSSHAPVSGVLSGHIQAIPEPATVLVLSIGLLICRSFGKEKNI